MEEQKQTWHEEEEVGEDGALLRRHHLNNNNSNGSRNGDGMTVYFEPHQGNVSGHGVSGAEFNGTESSVSESSDSSDEELNAKTKDFVSGVINREVVIEFVKEEISGLSPKSTLQKLHDDQKTTNLEGPKNATEEVDADDHEDDDLAEETGNEFADLDLEKVLKKQNTHRLYCPKCSSRITRKVVLIPRRRRPLLRIPIIPKPDIAASGQDETPTPPTDVAPDPNGTPATPAIDQGQVPGTFFRCLSCFSIFELIGNRCKLFLFPGDRQEVQIVQDGQERPDQPKKHWFLDCFSPENTESSGDDQFRINIPPPDNLPLSVPTPPVTTPQPVPRQQPAADTPVGANNWDILKSIVYGGLVESITSLGVVSSAAGAGATTMNILAMGLANVIAGLFIIFDNLKELKNQSAANEQENRYQQLLGRRQNFARHVIVVILSYLVFGLVPPVVYGFSFRESDDTDLKIAAVAGSSFVCIFLLALAKAHSQTSSPRPYLSTVTYYLTSAVMASGLSYVVGDMFEKLIEQLGLFAPSSDAATPSLMQTNMMKKQGWSAY